MVLTRLLNSSDDTDLLPLELWHPEPSGRLDIRIDRDGAWWHEGSLVEHPRVLRALSRLLRREADKHYYLVTPVEKWRIEVDDHPFLIVDACRKVNEADVIDNTNRWMLTTNSGEVVCLGEAHQLTLDDTDVPIVNLPHGLAARLSRQTRYQLIEQAETFVDDQSHCHVGLYSAGIWQPLGHPFDASDPPAGQP